MSSILQQIKNPKSQVYRKVYIKRRLSTTALYEDDWLDISEFVISWGKISTNVDAVRLNTFQFGNFSLKVNNENGEFNSEDDPNSLWFGFLPQQRTLVRIDAGFLVVNRADTGLISVAPVPGQTLWDQAQWDSGAFFDEDSATTIYKGIISGDNTLNDGNQAFIQVRPLNQVFVDYPARNLNGFTSTGVTASQFVSIVRDQTDGSGNYLFRPFFDNTTSSWDISSTSNVYSNLNTSGAEDLSDKSAWDVITKLAESENFIPYITKEGIFKFINRNFTSTSTFEFHGVGSVNNEYGQTIKGIRAFGKKISKYYSRIEVKFRDPDTSTSYERVQSEMIVDRDSAAWAFGQRTFRLENLWIPTSTVAATIAQNLFADYGSLREEIELDTTFIPTLNVLDRVNVYYDPTQVTDNSLWDLYDWAEDVTQSASDLIWDNSRGNGIKLSGQEFRIISETIDLDNFSNQYIMRRS